jgi:hypothetical protein
MKKTIYTLFAILGFANFTMAQLPSYVPASGLVAFYPFNGNANDASGNGNNGSVVGPTLTLDRNGNPNSAYSFSSVSDRIPVPSINCNNILTYTISGWFKKNYNSGTPNIDGTIFGQSNGCQGSNGLRLFVGTDNLLYWQTEAQTTFCGGRGIRDHVRNYSDSAWHFFAVTFNGSTGNIYSSQFKIYIDNIWVSSAALDSVGNGNFTAPVANTTNSTTLGNVNSGVDAMVGKLDDIGIWNRVLTSTEIETLYIGCNDTITTQPTNQVGNKGTNKTFSFAHSGTGNSYQWQSNAAVLGWQNVPNVTPYTGATTNSLTVNNLSVSNHNQLFRVVTSKTGCKDTSNAVSLTLANIATDSLRLLRLQADSSRLTNESIIYLARINKLMNDSAYYTSRILKLSNDSVLYVSRIAKLTNDSVYYTGRISKLISDSNVFVARINKLSYDSVYYLSRINKLTNDSVYYTGRISKLISDSSVFVARINKLSYDSLTNLGRITNLKIDSINNKTTIGLLNADIVTKGNIITFLQLDTTNKGITIRQLQTDLINKHDTVYVASVITSDTLRIAIRTGISSASPIINSLKVYPNPASTLLYIDLEKPGYFTAKLSSITGQSIITPTSGTIDVSSLANGVYILTIYDSNNKLISTNKVAIVK